jgi:hypothetical protein
VSAGWQQFLDVSWLAAVADCQFLHFPHFDLQKFLIFFLIMIGSRSCISLLVLAEVPIFSSVLLAACSGAFLNLIGQQFRHFSSILLAAVNASPFL